MKRRLLVIFGLLLTTSVVTADPAQIETGAELYDENCAGCHGDDVDGLQNFSYDLAGFSDLLEDLTPGMPDFADYFDDDEIAALHAFLADTIGTAGD